MTIARNLGLFFLAPSLLAQHVEIPFQIGKHSMTVAAILNGRDTIQLLFDTGWHATTLDSAVVARLSISRLSGASAVRADSVKIGPIVMRGVTLRVLNVYGITPPGEREVHGVLGATFLESRTVQLDFSRQVIRILDSAAVRHSLSPDAFTTAMHFSRLGLLPIIDSVIVDGRALRGMIDTGAGLPFLLTPKATALLGLSGGQAVRAAGYTDGQARRGSARLVTLPRVRLGPLVADSSRAILAGNEMPHLDQPLSVYGVIVGLEFLRKHCVTLDYRRRLVTLEPGRCDANGPMD